MTQLFNLCRPYLIGLLLITAMIGAQIIFAPKSSKAATAECFVANDFHMVRFTFYRVERIGDKSLIDGVKSLPKVSRHCQKAPDHGRHFLTVDLMQREQRGVPISVSLEQETPNGQFSTIKMLAAQQYKTGVLEIEHREFGPGNYRLQLVFDGGILEDDTLNIPFKVMVKKEFDALQG